MPNTHSTLTALFSDIADAIRSKTGGTASIAASAFPSAIAAIPTGSITISGTSSIKTTGIYDITSYASVDIDVSSQDLFYALVQNQMYQTLLEDSTITIVVQDAFEGVNYLNSIYFPNCTSVGSSAFRTCASLTGVNLPECTYIQSSAFHSCANLTTVNLPKVSYINTGAFQNCTKLESGIFPQLLDTNTFTFYGCNNLSVVSVPVLKRVVNQMFQQCSELKAISLPNVTQIQNSGFTSCYNLLSVYLMGSSLVSLGSGNAFANTPISNRTTSTGGVYGSIYVPSSLYATYISATNWVNYSSRFVSV